MLLGPSSLSECFLTRKMDYTGNSISNKISIYLKEFQDFYWEYLAAVFPLWFTAALVQVVLRMAVLLHELPGSGRNGGHLPNLKGHISDKNHPVKLEKSATFLEEIQRKPRGVHTRWHIPVIRAGKIGTDTLHGGPHPSPGPEVQFFNYHLHIIMSRIYAKAHHFQ